MTPPPFPNSYWLEPDRVLCGEYPRHRDDDAEHASMAAILKAGVRVFVDLTEEGELKPYFEIARDTAARLGIDPGSLEHRRHPIRDVSVPRSAEEMRAILRALRLERHRGRTVYLHCWGGRGRTGTVAACWLKEFHDCPGEEALARLASRWQACAKSRKHDSPETDGQCRYVLDWDSRRLSIAAACRAALLGSAVGDALGVPVEFQGRAARKADPVADMRAYGTHHQPAGTWSDDTSMILATMEGLARSGRCDPAAVMEEFVAWMAEGRHTPHGEVFDIGNATRAAISRAQAGTPPLQCGGSDEWSNGNGSLMRILPVALAHADDPDLVERASEISSLTHAHERSRFCCDFYCLVASELLHGEPLEAASAFAWEALDHRWTFSPEERPRFDALRPDRLFSREEGEIRSGGHVVDTLEAALWCLHTEETFAAAVLRAVNLGDDTDTTGCVAGGLAGLLHGEAAIPAPWIESLARREELLQATDRFAAHCADARGAVDG